MEIAIPRQTKYGLLLDHQFPRTDDLSKHIDEMIKITELARDLGFQGIFGIHHFLANMQTPQPFQLLARLIPHSGDMDLGTCVYISTLTHPVQIAEELATLDQLSKGRVIFGAGIGYRNEEFDSFGITRSSRAPRFIEALEIIRGLWSDELFTYSGEHYKLRQQRSSVQPYKSHHIPYWIGANTPETIIRAAKIGDAWIASPNVKAKWAIGNLASFCQERDSSSQPKTDQYDRPICREMFIADSDEEARAIVAPYLDAEYREYSKYDLDYFKSMYDDMFEKSFLVGSPKTVAQRINNLIDGGFNYFLFRTFWSGMPYPLAANTLRRFQSEVIPMIYENRE